MGIDIRDVEFGTEDGTILRGRIYSSADSGGGVGIVMAHGFGAVQEMVAHYAELFAASGFNVLLYDHRGFGISDGMPRQEVDPNKQIADWRDAITYALDQPGFASRGEVGIWGSSFAGGLAIVIAAIDSRVKCVVAQIPNVSGYRNSRKLFTAEQLDEIRIRAARDRSIRLQGGDPDTVPVFSEDPNDLCGLPVHLNDAFIANFRAAEANTSWRNYVTLRSVEHLVQFEPAGWIAYVAPTPLLMIIGDNDDCTFPDLQRSVFEQAGEPKKLVSHRGGHFNTYDRHFETSGVSARDWFVEHLAPSDGDALPYPR